MRPSSILAAIAIPNFLRCQQRAKIGEVRAARDTVKMAATNYIENTGYLPGSLEEMGLANDFSNTAVQGVESTESGFVLHLDPKLGSDGQPAPSSLSLEELLDELVAFYEREQDNVDLHWNPYE